MNNSQNDNKKRKTENALPRKSTNFRENYYSWLSKLYTVDDIELNDLVYKEQQKCNNKVFDKYFNQWCNQLINPDENKEVDQLTTQQSQLINQLLNTTYSNHASFLCENNWQPPEPVNSYESWLLTCYQQPIENVPQNIIENRDIFHELERIWNNYDGVFSFSKPTADYYLISSYVKSLESESVKQYTIKQKCIIRNKIIMAHEYLTGEKTTMFRFKDPESKPTHFTFPSTNASMFGNGSTFGFGNTITTTSTTSTNVSPFNFGNSTTIPTTSTTSTTSPFNFGNKSKGTQFTFK